MATRNNTVLVFNSNFGEKVRLSIPRADMTLTPARAQEAMEAMIDADIIVTSGGMPRTIRSAELVTVTRSGLVV